MSLTRLSSVPDDVKTRNIVTAICDGDDPEDIRYEETQLTAAYAWRVILDDGSMYFISADDGQYVCDPFSGNRPDDYGPKVGRIMKLDLATGESRWGGEQGHRVSVHKAVLDAWNEAGILVPAKYTGDAVLTHGG